MAKGSVRKKGKKWYYRFYVCLLYTSCREFRGNNLLNGYVWLEIADTLTKDEATEILSQISEETGLNNWTVSSYYDYVNTTLSFSNYAVYGVCLLYTSGIPTTHLFHPMHSTILFLYAVILC